MVVGVELDGVHGLADFGIFVDDLEILLAIVIAAELGNAPGALGEAALLISDDVGGEGILRDDVRHDGGVADVAVNLNGAVCHFRVIWVELGEVGKEIFDAEISPTLLVGEAVAKGEDKDSASVEKNETRCGADILPDAIEILRGENDEWHEKHTEGEERAGVERGLGEDKIGAKR